MKVTRRNAMVMGAFAPAGEFAVPGGGSTDNTTQGINVKLFWVRSHYTLMGGYQGPGWCVVTPDWESIDDDWQPGMPVKWKYVWLKDYLKEMEQEFKLVPEA